MLITQSAIKNFNVNARDKSDIGKINDFIFEENTHRVYYAVLNFGSWLLGEKIAIKPKDIHTFNPSSKIMDLDLSTKEIENSPHRDEVSTETDLMLNKLNESFGFTDPFGNLGFWGHVPTPALNFSPDLSHNVGKDNMNNATDEAGEAHMNNSQFRLRAVSEVKNYDILDSTLNKIGSISDMIFDLDSGIIRYYAIDTGSFFNSKEFLVSHEWIKSIDTKEKQVVLELSKDSLEMCPSFKASEMLTRKKEQQLHDYFEKEYYWPKA